MTIRRDYGKVVFECDKCDEEYTLDDGDFDLTYQAAKRDGWETKKFGRDWLHACPRCML